MKPLNPKLKFSFPGPAWCAMLTMELQPAVHMQHMGHGLAAGDQHHQILMPNNQMHMQHQEDENKKKQRDYRHQMPYESGNMRRHIIKIYAYRFIFSSNYWSQNKQP